MIARRLQILFSTLGAFALLFAAARTSSAVTMFTIADSEGFEPPAYSTSFLGTGQLEGQFASTDDGLGSDQWLKSPVGGTSTAVVQDSIVASGFQAVRVDRAANSDDRWAVPVDGYPGLPLVCINWDMYVEQATTTPAGSFGPFFGIEAYDDDATSLLRMGSLGVDAATGDVLVTDADFGLIETGAVVGFDEWHSFQMILDFSTDSYFGFVDRALVYSGNFEFPGADQFTDADIMAIAAGNDANSQAAIGTAYFDNYSVIETDDFTKIPEPATVVLACWGALCLACWRSL